MASSQPRGLSDLGALMTRVLGRLFSAESWRNWRTLLSALEHGLDGLGADERAFVQQVTNRTRLPRQLAELWLILGRRAGKSMIAALLAVWATCCRRYTLAPGEVGVFMVIAADRRQARVVKRYISGLLRASSVLEQMVARETKEAIWLTNGLCIEIHTCSFRSLRGYTCIGAILDEIAFWDAEDSANPDHEVLVALRAAMATVPEALLVALTSPYARRGEAWKTFDRHFGNNNSDRVLVVNAPTRLLNPTVSQSVIDAAYEEDPQAAAAEFGGEWRRDVEAFLPAEAVDAVVMPGRLEQPPMLAPRYIAFTDPAGGSGQDSFTLAIAHREASGLAVLDLVREVRPPFSPQSAVASLAEDLRRYRVTDVTGDRYAGQWPADEFRRHGVHYRPSERTKSELYVTLLPLVMSARVELLDLPRLRKQLVDLERRTARGGRDSIDHPPRAHDDVANAVAGVLVAAGHAHRTQTGVMHVPWIQ